jgi:hypothetical protein
MPKVQTMIPSSQNNNVKHCSKLSVSRIYPLAESLTSEVPLIHRSKANRVSGCRTTPSQTVHTSGTTTMASLSGTAPRTFETETYDTRLLGLKDVMCFPIQISIASSLLYFVVQGRHDTLLHESMMVSGTPVAQCNPNPNPLVRGLPNHLRTGELHHQIARLQTSSESQRRHTCLVPCKSTS